MKSMNKTQLIGYLGADPEIKEFKSGAVLAILRMATHRLKKEEERVPGADPYHTTWHNVRVWGREQIEKLLHQFITGSHVLVEGTIDYRLFVNKKGEHMQFANITAHTIMNLDC
jgi:single-strand DNA-binding protein